MAVFMNIGNDWTKNFLDHLDCNFPPTTNSSAASPFTLCQPFATNYSEKRGVAGS
jgi:hypothetical protein